MKTPCLILALAASVATAFAVDPPPDGDYQYRRRTVPIAGGWVIPNELATG